MGASMRRLLWPRLRFWGRRSFVADSVVSFSSFAFGVAFGFPPVVSFFTVSMAMIFLPSDPCVINTNAGNARPPQFFRRAWINPIEIIALGSVLTLSGKSLGICRFSARSPCIRRKFQRSHVGLRSNSTQKRDSECEISIRGESSFSRCAQRGTALRLGANAHFHLLFENAFANCVGFCADYMEKFG